MSFLKQKCKLYEPANLSSDEALIGRVKIVKDEPENIKIDHSETYEEFWPKKIIWHDNSEYQGMTSRILSELLSNFDQPEHLPAILEMSSNMIAMCAEKCYELKKFKELQIRTTPSFAKPLRESRKTTI